MKKQHQLKIFIVIIAILATLFLANKTFSQTLTLFDPATFNPSNLPAGMSIVDIDGEKYLKAPLNGWDTFIEIDSHFIPSEVTHLIFTAKYKSGNSGYTPEQTTSFFQFLPSNWSENVNDNPPSSAEFISHRIPFNKPSGMSCGVIQLAGRETISGNWNVITGDTIFLGKVRTFINDPTVIFDPNYYENVDLPAGMSIVQTENERYLQVVTNGWNSLLTVPRFEITAGHLASCNHKFSLGSISSTTLSPEQVQSMIVLIDNENTIPNPWGEGEIQAHLTLTHNPALSEMENMSGQFIPEMKYVHNIQFAGQETVSWGPTTGDTIWVRKIEQIKNIPPSHIEVKKTTIAPMLDGVEEQCWNGVDAVPIEQNFVNEDPTVTAYWKAMWADSGLFVLVNVMDDNHFPAWEAGSSETWMYDNTEVAFDVNSVLDDGLGAQNNQGHYQYSGNFLEGLYGSPITNPQLTYANQLSGENRITEYFFPFNQMQNKEGVNLNKESILALDSIGFDVYVVDQDEGITDRRHRKVWQNTGTTNENWANMNDAGTIRLVDEAMGLSDSVLVTFRVDMRDEPIGPMGVRLRGSFNGWQSDYPMTCTYNKVYEITLELPKNTYFEYKFRNGDLWESPEGECNAGGGNTNRTLNVVGENLILDLVCYNSCSLCPPSHIEVAKTETAPVLDGIIDAVWNDFDAIPISKNFLNENPSVDAYWKAMWADAGIYVLINVQDDVHYPSWEAESTANWEYDHLEVYFDVNENLYDGRGSKDNQGHYSYSPVFTKAGYGTVQSTGSVNYSNLLYGEGIVSEMFFPFESFVDINSQAFSKNNFLMLDAIGFDVYVVDQDEGITDRRHRKVWQNNGLVTENWANMNDAGTIRLVGEAPNFNLIESDSLALVALYNATNGNNWNNKQNWLTSKASEWYGVSIENTRVVALNLFENNLSGQLPADLAHLTALTTLNLGGNGNLDQGAIPNLSGLTALRELVLYSSNRNGTVPNWLLQSNTIQRVNISGNAISGAIPTNFSNPLNIRSLDIGWNQFDTPSGFPDYSAFTNLESLRLAGCNITAQVPAYLENFPNLFNLHIDNNHLWGDLPAGLKTQTNLNNLEIQYNNFTFRSFAAAGIVPSEMGSMNYSPQAKMQLGRSETETQVTFDASGFGGEAYKWFKDDVEIAGQTGSTLVVNKTNKGLYHCEIFNNQYPNLMLVSIAEDVGVCTNGIYTEEYDALVAFYNALDGDNWNNNTNWLSNEPVNTWFGIEVVDNHVFNIGLWWNNLSGSIPAEIEALSNLRNLNLSGNSINSIPAEIGNLEYLINLNLFSNQITSLPANIIRLSLLNELIVGRNQLSSIPSNIDSLSNLTILNLANNQIDVVPATIGRLANLEIIDLSGNQLTTLPAEMNNLTSLTDLWVAVNQLESLPNLSSLSLLKVGIDYNKLTYSDIVGSGINPTGEFGYHEQAKIEADYNNTGTGYTLDVSFAGAQSHQWFKNGVEMPGETNALLTVNGYDSDYYYCILNHSSYPNLTLESEPQSVAGYLTHGIVTAEYNALVDLYNSTNGNNWRDNWNWLSEAPINEWSGVRLNGIHVSELHLGGNKLSGSLPVSFNSFTELKRVNFYGNALMGLPNLSGLTGIEFFNIAKNALDYNDFQAANFAQPIVFDFQYFNQQNIIVNRSENSGQITFTVPDVGGTWFQWYHNSISMPDKVSNSLTVNNNANGYYYCIIGNAAFPNLQLQTVAEEIGESNLTCGILTSEYNALVAIFNATGGRNWNNNTNWLTTNSVSTWQGVTVNGVNVTWLDLGYNNLTGILPGETADLTRLNGLQFRGNHLSALHSNVGNLANLSTFDLCDNDLTAFPEAICRIGSLRWLYLENNDIVGAIPEAIGNLTNLWDLFLSNNQLFGQIPSSMENLIQLVHFDISRNNLNGQIPAAMGNNAALKEFRIQNNQFHHAHIENVMAWNNFAGFESFEYAPQQLVGIEKTIYTQEGNSIVLFINNYTASVNDRYQWYKDDVLINGETSATLELSNVTMGDAGLYYCDINNTVTTQLNLKSRNISLSIGSIGLVGTFNNWGAQPDVPFVQSSANSELWQLEYHFVTNTSIKFRINSNWSTNWGGDSFPQSSMVYYGNDILVPAGNYSMELDMNAMTYRFTNQTISDSLALVTLYNSTNGDNWNQKTNWLTGPLNTWQNVTVENGRVVGLNFGWNNNIVGTLPAEIGNLTAIKWFIASGNDGLTGSIPTEIGNLTNLETLAFYNCSLTGTIPSGILNFSKLQSLELSFNNFDAAPMPDFGQLNQLRNLVIEECNFTGDIPAGLSNLILLENVYLNGNPGLNAGAIPDLSRFRNIINLGMASCNRTGTIPSWISQIVNLETLVLRGNSLTGNIPSAFSNAAYIRDLDLSWNQFSAASLPNYGNFERLERLMLAGCNLTGTIPEWLTTLTNIKVLNISYNMLEGIIPEAIGNLTGMEHLNIEANRLRGPVPVSLSNMINLKEFYLNNNQLSGNMPVMSGLTQLFILRNSSNKFTFANIAATGRVPGDITHFVYSPQDTILGIEQDGNSLTALDFGYANNVINWYRDGSLISSNTDKCEADQTGNYSFTVTNAVFNFLTLYSDTLYVEIQSVPVDLPVNNFTLPSGQSDCFNAQNDITVAGSSLVTIQNNANAIFIAGHSIRFLPGFHAQEGSYVDAHITTTGSFCDDLPTPIMAAEPLVEKSATEPITDENENQSGSILANMKVYPNPNNGQFTVIFDNFDNETKVLVYNTYGQKVYQTITWEKSTVVELQHVRRGIYFVKAINNQRHYEQKIIVQ